MKVIKYTADSKAAIVTGETYSSIIAGSNSISSDREGGNFILGPTSFSSNIDNIRVGPFKFNPILASCLPSTMITPVPTLVLEPPIKNIASMAAIASMVSSLGF